MLAMDERLVADYGHLEPTYVDGIGGMYALGTENFAVLYYRNQPKYLGNDGLVVLEPTPVMVLIRPRRSVILCNPNCVFASMIGESRTAPVEGLN